MPKGQRRAKDTQSRPIAAVYRGPVGSPGCAESLADFLRRSPARFQVHYLGPDETHDISSATLSHLDLLAWPGGGDDQALDFPKISQYSEAIQNFVRNGGLYLGVCLGAFFARGPGGTKEKSEDQTEFDGKEQDEVFFGLLPSGSYVSSERFEKGAEVEGDEDTIIRTDWTWGTGQRKGEVDKGKWQYFQDGGQIQLGSDVEAMILGRYSATQNPCATITPFGKGHVGLIGVHPEADGSWYEDWNGKNPDGISFDMGYDFVQTLWEKKTVWNDWMNS